MDLSITERLQAEGAKTYLRHLAHDGYEMGVGFPGTYPAHAHRGFTDIAFAPGGLTIANAAGDQTGLLHLTPPGTWFGPITFHSAFWFIKLFQSMTDRCHVPDKITDRPTARREGCFVFSQVDVTLPTTLGRNVRFLIKERLLHVTGLAAPTDELVVSA